MKQKRSRWTILIHIFALVVALAKKIPLWFLFSMATIVFMGAGCLVIEYSIDLALLFFVLAVGCVFITAVASSLDHYRSAREVRHVILKAFIMK